MSKIFVLTCAITLILISIQKVVGQDSNRDEVTKSIYIDHEKSHIEILGKTNVNQFTCHFDMSTLQPKNSVQLAPYSNQQQLVNGTIQLKVGGFNCDNSQMTHDFKNLLKYKSHPYITLKVKKITKVSENEYDVDTSIQLAGEEQKYTMRLNANTENDIIQCSGKQEICISDFGLVAPEKFFGMVKVNEDISINFYLVLEIK